MAANTFLAGDLGGTKTLLALYSESEEGLNKIHSHRYVSAEWSDLESMLGDFLKTLPQGLSKPETSCIAVAGPVQNGTAKLTNLPWSMSEASLCKATGLQRLELVNDFAVLIHGLPHFSASQQVVLQTGSGRDAPAAAGQSGRCPTPAAIAPTNEHAAAAPCERRIEFVFLRDSIRPPRLLAAAAVARL